MTANAGPRALERLRPAADRGRLGVGDDSPLGPPAVVLAHPAAFAAAGLPLVVFGGRTRAVG